MLLETRVIDLHYAADSFCLSSFQFCWWAPQDFSISIYFYKRGVSAVQGHPRSLILVPIESAYIYILVHNCNHGPILHRFGPTARFMCSWPHPYSTLILGLFPLHQIAHVGRQRVEWAHGP